MDAAILFDMDDTLVASGPIWRRAETRLFRALGAEYRADVAATYKGQNVFDLGAAVWEALRPAAASARDCGEMMHRFLLEEFSGQVPPLPGADALIRALAPHYPLAVASGSPAEAIHDVLWRSGWAGLFRAVVSSERVSAGKPAPDVLLRAAELLGVEPAHCLVFEDSLHGVRAAKAARMVCFVVPSLQDERIVRLADRLFPSLEAVSTDDVRAALGQASTKKG